MKKPDSIWIRLDKLFETTKPGMLTVALQLGATRAAFIAASVPEDKARAATEELAGYDNRLASIDSRVSVLTWRQPRPYHSDAGQRDRAMGEAGRHQRIARAVTH